MFRVLNLTLKNFKGFKDMTFYFEKPRTILGGPNGYGKTSIFDALELLFTGRIERMEVYMPGHDNRTSLNNEYKPLVYDTSIDEIVIEALLQFSETDIVKVRRHAEQQRMRNPVDFEAFSNIEYFDETDGVYKDVDNSEKLSLFFGSLANQYQFLNYLTQEEANQFLKCKESDRKQQINGLFQTNAFDNPINRLTTVRNEVNGVAQAVKSEIDQLKEDVNRLKSTNVGGEKGGDNPTEYVRLFNTEIDWDKENPQISYEGFSNVLRDGGTLDDLLYFGERLDLFKWYQLNERMLNIQSQDNLNRLAHWIKWIAFDKQIVEFGEYTDGLRRMWTLLTLSNVASFSVNLPTQLPVGVVDKEVLARIESQLSQLKNTIKSTGAIQKAYADLLGSRNVTERTLAEVEELVHTSKCPLCGSQFDSEALLLQNVHEFGTLLGAELESLTNGVSSEIEELKKIIGDFVIKPIDGYYHSAGINQEVFETYRSLDKKVTKDQYDFLCQHIPMQLDVNATEEEIGKKLFGSIERWRNENSRELPEEFDTVRLHRVQNGYGRFVNQEVLNKENVEKKRLYLTRIWNAISSQLMAEKTAKLTALTSQYEKLNNQSKLLKRTCDSIKGQKNAFLSNMVSQIETLFYIYTGRIMQDNYYGRGCYLKYNQNNSVVLFTSGSYNNEVDAIFKMSSGQLVSISIAFMLTVNKLYADNAFIAIDDPVQTIDDLNLWGLMETLRHDFKKSSVLLSTHERDFGLLLTDKFNKVGLQTDYVDLSMHH